MIEQRVVYARAFSSTDGHMYLNEVNDLIAEGWRVVDMRAQVNGNCASGMVFLLERVKPEAK